MEFYPQSRPAQIKDAMQSVSQMSKLKAQTGLRISLPHSISTYVLERKIRKIIAHYSHGAPSGDQVMIDKMVNKLDALETTDIQFLHHLGTEESVSGMLAVMRMKFKEIARLSQKWREDIELTRQEQQLANDTQL